MRRYDLSKKERSYFGIEMRLMKKIEKKNQKHKEEISDIKEELKIVRKKVKMISKTLNPNVVIVKRKKYTQGKVWFFGKWKWVHIGSNELLKNHSKDELKKIGVRQFIKSLSKVELN